MPPGQPDRRREGTVVGRSAIRLWTTSDTALLEMIGDSSEHWWTGPARRRHHRGGSHYRLNQDAAEYPVAQVGSPRRGEGLPLAFCQLAAVS
jgi:hypothetical protein